MKSVVLLSGGLDSSVNLHAAAATGGVLLALTFDYGQRAAKKEIAAAKQLTSELKIPHQVVDLPFFSQLGHSSLIDKNMKLPLRSEINITSIEVSQSTAKSVWVPNRNGIFLNIAAGFAEALGGSQIVPGFNAEEAATFPDNSIAYMTSLNESFGFSTANQVKVICMTSEMDKVALVKYGNSLGVQWNWTWPCYQSLENWCGECESCRRAKRAFSANGVSLENFMA